MQFDRFVCIDWSGAAVANPPGLAVAYCEPGRGAPSLLKSAKGWSRQAILDWLLRHAREGTRMLVGLDLSPGLPFAAEGTYFPGHPEAPTTARELWAYVDRLCEQEPYLSASSFPIRDGIRDHFRNHTETGSKFGAGAGRMREVEKLQRLSGVNPVSCFNLVGAAQVGKSSLTGMRMLHRLGGKIPIWPFDPAPESGPLIVEIYTSIAARDGGVPKGRSKITKPEELDDVLGKLDSDRHRKLQSYDDHSTDAIITAAWLRKVAHEPDRWTPDGLTPEIAQTEGWTFGVC